MKINPLVIMIERYEDATNCSVTLSLHAASQNFSISSFTSGL